MTHLTARFEKSEGSPASSLLEVGRLENDVGRLSAELERNDFQVRKGSGRSDVATDGGGSCEGDFVDVGVLGEGLAAGRTKGRRSDASDRCLDDGKRTYVTLPIPVTRLKTPLGNLGRAWATLQRREKQAEDRGRRDSPDLLHQLGEQEDRERGRLSGLEHDGAP